MLKCYSAIVRHSQSSISTFVILDEVEAALDEANVIRYAQYLNELSTETHHCNYTPEGNDGVF